MIYRSQYESDPLTFIMVFYTLTYFSVMTPENPAAASYSSAGGDGGIKMVGTEHSIVTQVQAANRFGGCDRALIGQYMGLYPQREL